MTRSTAFSAALLGVLLGAAGVAAQPATPAPGAGQPSPAQEGAPGTGGGMRMPMQGGMMGGDGGCPMMRRMASLDERLRRLEERSGAPTPQAQPAPSQGTGPSR